jgi:hypothetical protein
LRNLAARFKAEGGKMVDAAKLRWDESKPDLGKSLKKSLDKLIAIDKNGWFTPSVFTVLNDDAAAKYVHSSQAIKM